MVLAGLMDRLPPTWLIVLLACLLWGGEKVRRDLWEPDEARYAYVAREMRDGGHWFVPHINGQPYPDKPPLMFWLINLSAHLTGGAINGVATRMPSLLGSVMTLWVVTRLTARWHSRAAAWRAMFILLTTFLFWQEGGWGRIDALLCGLVALSVYALFRSLDGQRTRWEMLAYTLAGLAVLAKGPIGLVLPVGIFAASALAGGWRAQLRRAHWLWGPAVALAIPGAWLLIAWLQDAPAAYFSAMFGEKSFGRIVASKGHDRPFYYFLFHFPLELLPWTIFLPAAVAAQRNIKLRRMLLTWIAFVILLFSSFVCKRNVYILAAYPAAAMLIGAAWQDLHRLPRRWYVATACAAMGLVWLLAVGMLALMLVPQAPLERRLLVPSMLVLVAGGLILQQLYQRERLGLRWLLAFCATFFCVQVTVSNVVMPGLNDRKTPVAAVRAMAPALPPDQPVYLYKQQLAIVPFYANRPGRELESVEELNRVVASNHTTVVVFREPHWQELLPQFGAIGTAHPFTMGHKQLVWVRFARGVPPYERQ